MIASPIRIDSAEDPRVQAFTRMRDRDLARATDGGGLFVAEGEVVLRVLAGRGRFRVRSLFLEERRVEALRDALSGLAPETPLYVASQSVMDAVVGFPIHRGVLALGERGLPLDPATLLAEPGLVVALVGVTNHDNVGSVFRSAAAFGARAVLHDVATCDPLYRKAVRVSVGAALMVPFACVPDADAMLALLERQGFEAVGLSPGGKDDIDALEPAPRRALVFGTEGSGLPPEVLARTRTVRIPMTGDLDSLNVGVATGIALYEASRRVRR